MRLMSRAALLLLLGGCCKAPVPAGAVPSPPRLPGLALASHRVSRDGNVLLTWHLRDVENTRHPPHSFLWRIERREAGGPWTLLKSDAIAGKNRVEFLDDDTKPRTDYDYKLAIESRDPRWPGWKSAPMPPSRIRTPGMWDIEFSNIQKDLEADHPVGQAYVTIRKHDKEHGMVEWRKIQHEGESLGAVTVNGVEDFNHRVARKDGRVVTVNFNIGGKVKKITTDKTVLYTYQRCASVPGRECEGPQEVKDSYRVNEVIYLDEDGKDQTFTTPSGAGPIADTLCDDHKTCRPPKPDDPEKVRGAAKALRALQEADRLWESYESLHLNEAQRLYRKVLNDHADHPDVVRRRAELTHRAGLKLR